MDDIIKNVNWKCDKQRMLYIVQQETQQLYTDFVKEYVEEKKKDDRTKDQVFYDLMDRGLRRKSPNALVQTNLQRLAEIRFTYHSQRFKPTKPKAIKRDYSNWDNKYAVQNLKQQENSLLPLIAMHRGRQCESPKLVRNVSKVRIHKLSHSQSTPIKDLFKSKLLPLI